MNRIKKWIFTKLTENHLIIKLISLKRFLFWNKLQPHSQLLSAGEGLGVRFSDVTFLKKEIVGNLLI
jgi:hypothetical protein